MLSSLLLDSVFLTVSALPPDTVRNVIAVLEMGDEPGQDAVRYRVLNAAALPQERAILTNLLNARVQENIPIPARQVATALESALHSRLATEQASRTELVWTGPASGMMFRRTDQALFEVINTAENDLLLVTFTAYQVPLLRDAIRDAIKRGVTISFLGESSTESGGKISFDAAKALGAISDQIRFYIWPSERRVSDVVGKTGTLHAKCALADRTVLLVSSANLTEHAMLLNMEMGVLIRGGMLPAQVSDHFHHLREKGYIRRV